MIKIMKYGEVDNKDIFARGTAATSVEDIVTGIIENVKANGDRALLEYTKKFDGAELECIEVTDAEMLEALEEPATMIVDAVHGILENTPPELAADISDRGIIMTGGGALIDGLDKLIASKMGINAFVANDAVSCVALGTGKALDNLDALDR